MNDDVVYLILALMALGLALWPAVLFLRNLLHFLPLSKQVTASNTKVTVLIPARNEAGTIAGAVEAVLASRGVDLQLVVLDDSSTDGTGEIVAGYAAKDSRVTLAHGRPLPAEWCGKQHACWQLAQQAMATRGEGADHIMVFLDADVRLAPDALERIAYRMNLTNVPLVSGFPRQETVTLLEQMLIPLMHFVLLGFLPMHRMRRSTAPAYAAGCGQLFAARADAYAQTGGHALIKASLHDGITLPRAYRQRGLMTDLFDATDIATCRMYRNAREVWYGLAKNATEGLASPTLILPVTFLLLVGQVLPLVLIGVHQVHPLEPVAIVAASLAAAIAYVPRVYSVIRFRQSLLGAILHPVSIVVLLVIQYYALARKLRGAPAVWKNRAYTPVP